MFQAARQGVVQVFSGDEPLNEANVSALADLIRRTPLSPQPMAVLDLQRIPLLDSAGLELLLDVHEDLTRRGGRLTLAAANELCRDILRATGMADLIESYADVRTAVGSFTK